MEDNSINVDLQSKLIFMWVGRDPSSATSARAKNEVNPNKDQG